MNEVLKAQQGNAVNESGIIDFSYAPIKNGRYRLTIKYADGQVEYFIRRSLEAIALKLEWIVENYECAEDSTVAAIQYR